MIRFATPILIIVYGIAVLTISAIPDVRSPLHGVSLVENIKFMFARVQWLELLSSHTINKIFLLSVLSLGFCIFKKRWVKLAFFLLLVWASYTFQVKYIVVQASIVLSDASYLMNYEEAVAGGYPFAHDVTIGFVFSVLLTVLVSINGLQVLYIFRSRKDDKIVKLRKDLGNWPPSV